MEIWKDIPGYESVYQVSSMGRVRSLDRVVKANTGERVVKGQILKAKIVKGGYEVLSLCKERKYSMRTAHSLVMLAFVGGRPEGYDICHNDGNPANNVLENLRYDTRKANHQDKRAHKTMACGVQINTSRLTEEQVMQIRNRRFAGETVKALGEAFGVSSVAISKICVGDNWKHVAGPLTPRQKRRSEIENQKH